MRTLMLIKNNMIRKEKKLKRFVILLFKRAWEKVEAMMMKKIATLTKIFDV
jgi:hypothetical protein